VLAVVTLASTLPSAYFSARELRNPDAEARRVARYLVVRSAALLLVAVVPLVHYSIGWLAAVAVAMTIVQASDAALGLARRNARFVIGPAVTAAATLGALWWVLDTGA
jgi:hypothetical protein